MSPTPIAVMEKGLARLHDKMSGPESQITIVDIVEGKEKTIDIPAGVEGLYLPVSAADYTVTASVGEERIERTYFDMYGDPRKQLEKVVETSKGQTMTIRMKDNKLPGNLPAQIVHAFYPKEQYPQELGQ